MGYNALAAGAPPQTPLGSLRRSLDPLILRASLFSTRTRVPLQWRNFNFFLGRGANFFFIFRIFRCHQTIEKLEKPHFICSNLTLFIVPFFLSFSSFFLFFLFFLLFFLFFLFPWGAGGATGPPSPSQMTPLCLWHPSSSPRIVLSALVQLFFDLATPWLL